MTSQRIPAKPAFPACVLTAASVNPPGGRHNFGVTPVAAVIASLARDSWLGTSWGGNVVMLGCSQVWLPSSMPASTTRLAPAGLAATLLPISKNVALALFAVRMLSSRSVYGGGPSSNVNARHLTCAQSTTSLACANRTCPVNAPIPTMAAAAATPATVRQYRQAWLSGRFDTAAAYRRRRPARLQRYAADLLEHLGDQRRDRRPLAAQQRDVREQRVALEFLDHRGDAIVPAHPQVVALSDIVSQHHPRSRAQPGQHGQQHVSFQGLRFVDDDERVVERATADMGQRQHLEHAAGKHLFERRGAGQTFEGVEDRLGPRAHLFALATG